MDYAIFGDTRAVKTTLQNCKCRYIDKIKHPRSNKIQPGWKVNADFIQHVIRNLKLIGTKIYLNGKEN